jgi:hypothetical protein
MVPVLRRDHFVVLKIIFFIPKHTAETQYVEVMGKEASDKIAFYASWLQERGSEMPVHSCS